MTASVRQQSLTRNILRLCFCTRRIWKWDIVVSDIDELERMDASEIHTWRLNAVLTQQKWWKISSRSEMEQSNYLEEIMIWEHPPESGKYRNCMLTNSLHHLHSWIGRWDSKTKRLLVLIFHRKLCCGSTKWRLSVHWKNWNLRDQLMENIPNFEMLDAKIASALKKIIRNSHLKKKVSLEERKAQKKDRFQWWNTDCLHDPRLFSSCWCSWYSDGFRWLFSVTLHNDNVQEIWYKIGWSFMSKMPSDDVLESLHKLRKRESAELKTVLELYDMKIHQKLRLRNFDARNQRIETGAVVTIRKGQRGVGRGQGECHQWKAKKDSGREETCSYRHDEDKRANRTPKAAESSGSPTHRGWSASRKRTSECGVHFGGSLDSCAKTTRDVFAPNHSVIIGILLKFNSIIQNRDVNSVMCSFAQADWRSTWQKKRKRMVANVQWLYLVGLRISGHRAAGIFIDKNPTVLGSIRRVRSSKVSRRHGNIRAH